MANKIKGLTLEIGGNTIGLNKALADVNKTTRDLKSELRDVDRLLKLDPGNSEVVAQKQKILAEAVENTGKKLETLKEAEKQAQEQFAKGEIAEDQYRAIQREVIKTEEELKKMNKQLKEMDWKGIADGFDKFGKKATEAGKKWTTRVTAPIVAAGTAGVKMALDIEHGIKKITTLADKDILPVDKIKKEVRSISNETGIAQTEIAESIYGALSAGVESEKVLSFVRSGINLTRAGFTDMGTAIDATTTVLNAYGDEAFDVEKIHDIFVQTQDKGKISVDELGKSLGRVVPTASSLGVNMDELGASYAILTAKGQKAELATTNLNSMLAEMGKSGSKTDKALKEMTGKSFAELIKEGKSVGEVLGLINEHAENNDLSLKDMFGSMTAGNAAVTLLSDGVEGYQKSLENMDNATGKTAENAATMEDGWFKIQKAVEQVKNALVEFGEMIAPFVEKLAEKISELVSWFSGLDDGTKELIGKAALFLAAVGPILLIVGKLSGSISNIINVGGKLIGSWGKIKGAASMLMGGLKATIGFIFSPAGAIMVGIAAVIAIGVLLWKNWDKIKEKATALWTGLKNTFDDIKNGISDKINSAKDTVKNAIDKIKGFFNFEWSLPKLKLPKISMDGKFSLIPPSVPKFSIKWNKEGAIFTKPTIFDTWQGLQGVGDDGMEAVLPIKKLGAILADTLKNMRSSVQTSSQYTMDHTGTITVRGVNDRNELMDVVEIVMDELRRDVRRA